MTTIHQEGYEALKERLAPLSCVSIVSTKVTPLSYYFWVLSDRLRTAHERYRTRLNAHRGRTPDCQQEVIVAFESERALAALPALLRDPADRARLLTLLERLATDPRVWKDRPAPDQIEMLAHPNGPRCRGTEGPPDPERSRPG